MNRVDAELRSGMQEERRNPRGCLLLSVKQKKQRRLKGLAHSSLLLASWVPRFCRAETITSPHFRESETKRTRVMDEFGAIIPWTAVVDSQVAVAKLTPFPRDRRPDRFEGLLCFICRHFSLSLAQLSFCPRSIDLIRRNNRSECPLVYFWVCFVFPASRPNL
jgi:hypothetical protein